MSLETEDWTDPDAILGECARCGEIRLVLDVVDPFVVERIWEDGPTTPEPWCYPCLSRRADDV